MSFAKTSLAVALLALMTGCGSVGMVTSSSKLASGAGASAGAPLTNGPTMQASPSVERAAERVDTSSRSTPREPLYFRMENCTRCN